MAGQDLHEPFDYIVVGGGTAGLVVASRLSEDVNMRVLVVEAGPDTTGDPLVLTPGLVAAQYGQDKYDWNFLSTPQPHLHNRCINNARGRQLGGSSALNFMMVMYPSRTSINAWAELGNEGWSFDELAPYYRKSSTVHSPSAAASEITGLDKYHDDSLSGAGPLHISFGEGYTTTVNGAWMETFSELGLKMATDPRLGESAGAFQNPASIDPTGHTRSYAASAYLGPEVRARANLVVVTDTVVKKVLTRKENDSEDVVAIGVVIQGPQDGEREVTARREVILAAGAFQTPQLLELSGIGDARLLESHGIPVVLDNPNVGENARDHAIVCQSFEVKDGIPSGDILRDPNVLNAVIQLYNDPSTPGAGPLGQSTISVAYAPLADKDGPLSAGAKKSLLAAYPPPPGAKPFELRQREIMEKHIDQPSSQYLLFPFQTTITEKPSCMAEIITPSRPENYLTIMTILNNPLSRGSVHIASADVAQKPLWDPKFMSEPLDLECLARNVQFVERIIETEPFKSVLKPGGKRSPQIIADGDDLENAREVVRQAQISVFHVCGTAPMMPRDQGGVVSERLVVHGTKNLRVVDASIFPLQIVGNIQSTVYAVAEKAADLIKEDREKK
ncbi:hypothetical protein BX600DRAFT_387997 [Xylariales sp. PMI_506]|nr:hypothetical protein BX600DRAFT_387997 [Xylariales sp. PMI_506]